MSSESAAARIYRVAENTEAPQSSRSAHSNHASANASWMNPSHTQQSKSRSKSNSQVSSSRDLMGSQDLADANKSRFSLTSRLMCGNVICQKTAMAFTAIMIWVRSLFGINRSQSQVKEKDEENPSSSLSPSPSPRQFDWRNPQQWIDWYHTFTLRPNSRIRKRLTIYLNLCVFYNAIIIPLRMSFIDKDLINSPTIWILLLDYFVVDPIYIVDMFCKARTTFTKDGRHVQELDVLWQTYISEGGFRLHLISILPFDILAIYFGQSALPFLRLNRVVRLLSLQKLLSDLEKYISANVNVMRLVKLMIVIILYVHWSGCLFFLIGSYESGEETWLHSNNVHDMTKAEQYVISIYWSIVTFATVGYGDIIPKNMIERIYTIVIVFIGAAVYATIFGNMTNLIASLDADGQRYRERLDSLNEYMRYRDLPYSLRERIRDYYDVIWSRHKGLDEGAILDQLPPSLRSDVALYLNHHLVEKVPLFQDCNIPGFINSLVVKLKPQVALPGDYVIRHGEIGREMYFLSHGEVEVLSGDGKTVYATLKEGSYFGEIALLFEARRIAHIRTTTYCDLLMLTKDDFDSVLCFFPTLADEMRQKAKEKISEQRMQAANRPPVAPKRRVSLLPLTEEEEKKMQEKQSTLARSDTAFLKGFRSRALQKTRNDSVDLGRYFSDKQQRSKSRDSRHSQAPSSVAGDEIGGPSGDQQSGRGDDEDGTDFVVHADDGSDGDVSVTQFESFSAPRNAGASREPQDGDSTCVVSLEPHPEPSSASLNHDETIIPAQNPDVELLNRRLGEQSYSANASGSQAPISSASSGPSNAPPPPSVSDKARPDQRYFRARWKAIAYNALIQRYPQDPSTFETDMPVMSIPVPQQVPDPNPRPSPMQQSRKASLRPPSMPVASQLKERMPEMSPIQMSVPQNVLAPITYPAPSLQPSIPPLDLPVPLMTDDRLMQGGLLYQPPPVFNPGLFNPPNGFHPPSLPNPPPLPNPMSSIFNPPPLDPPVSVVAIPPRPPAASPIPQHGTGRSRPRPSIVADQRLFQAVVNGLNTVREDSPELKELETIAKPSTFGKEEWKQWLEFLDDEVRKKPEEDADKPMTEEDVYEKRMKSFQTKKNATFNRRSSYLHGEWRGSNPSTPKNSSSMADAMIPETEERQGLE